MSLRKRRKMESECSPSPGVWDVILKQNPRVVQVDLLQHAPLSREWSRLAFVGTVVEVQNKYLPEISKLNKNNPSVLEGFWYAEVIQWAGYYAKLNLLGYPDMQQKEVQKYQDWVHFKHLKNISFFGSLENSKTHVKGVPPIPIFCSSEGDILNSLFKSMLSKFSVNRLCEDLIKNSLVSNWGVGNRVEVVDKDCISRMKTGFIGKLLGKRAMIKYWDAPNNVKAGGYWVHVDSPLLHHAGWSEAVGLPLSSPTSSIKSVVAPDPDSVANGEDCIEEGMLFEVINPVKSNQIAVGKVTQVLQKGFFKYTILTPVLESDLRTYANGVNEFFERLSSDSILPLGTAFKNGVRIPGEKSVGGLSKSSNKKMPIPEKTMKHPLGMENGAYVEVVDGTVTKLVCPAKIVETLGSYAVRIHFLGCTADYDQWKPLSSLDIFPVGWCDIVGYALAPIGTDVQLEVELSPKKRKIEEKPKSSPSEPVITSPEVSPTKITAKAPRKRKSQEVAPKLVALKKELIVKVERLKSSQVKSELKQPKETKTKNNIKKKTPPAKSKKSRKYVSSDSSEEEEFSFFATPKMAKTTVPSGQRKKSNGNKAEKEKRQSPKDEVSPNKKAPSNTPASGTRKSGRNRTAPTFFGNNAHERSTSD